MINRSGQLVPTPASKHRNNATKKTAEFDLNYTQKNN